MVTGTAAVSPTNWWFALYDDQATPALVAQTLDQTTTALTANTIFSLALQSPAPYTVPRTAVYYAAWMVKAGTVAGWFYRGSGSNPAANGPISGMKRMQGSSGSGLTTTAPATIASPSATGFQIWVGVS
jgi:hypothetical protein